MSKYIRNDSITKGIVVDTDDPAGFNRVKVRIPSIHGLMDISSYGPLMNKAGKMWVDDNLLPWAEISYPFGNTTKPEINQVVWVVFMNGDTEYPVILGWAGYEYTPVEEKLE